MKAVVIERFGPADGLAVVDLPAPEPEAGQVLIETEAIGVGGVDAVIRRGAIAGYGFAEGHVPGGEVAGVVTAVGAGVDHGWIGQRVWAFTGTGGGYAEYAAVPVERTVPLPAKLSAPDAVTLGGSGLVAHFALARAGFSPGESVLVRAAAGGIGVMAVQLAARARARAGAGSVAVTTSSAERGERLRELGATRVLDRSGGDEHERFDVIVDVAGGAELPAFLERLRPNGRLLLVGIVAGMPPADFGAAMLRSFQRSTSFATFSADTVSEADRRAVHVEQFEAAERAELRAVVHEVLPLERAALAHQKMDAGEVFGRIVLEPRGMA